MIEILKLYLQTRTLLTLKFLSCHRLKNNKQNPLLFAFSFHFLLDTAMSNKTGWNKKLNSFLSLLKFKLWICPCECSHKLQPHFPADKVFIYCFVVIKISFAIKGKYKWGFSTEFHPSIY